MRRMTSSNFSRKFVPKAKLLFPFIFLIGAIASSFVEYTQLATVPLNQDLRHFKSHSSSGPEESVGDSPFLFSTPRWCTLQFKEEYCISEQNHRIHRSHRKILNWLIDNYLNLKAFLHFSSSASLICI